MILPIGKSIVVKKHLKVYNTETNKVYMTSISKLEDNNLITPVYGICPNEENLYNFLSLKELYKELDEVDEHGKPLNENDNVLLLCNTNSDLTSFSLIGAHGVKYTYDRQQMINKLLDRNRKTKIVGIAYYADYDVFDISNINMFNVTVNTFSRMAKYFKQIDGIKANNCSFNKRKKKA